jgi:pyruvate dehydrogenase E2 component (dihydrolipoamide acetyltransferase)
MAAATEHLGPYTLSPAARHLLESRSLELFKDVQGTGKGGRVTKGDVIHAIANGQVATKVRAAPAPPKPAAAAAAAAPAAPAAAPPAAAAAPTPVSATIPEIVVGPGGYVDTKNSNMRKVIARRLAESKAGVPHSYETVECGAF